MKTVTSQVQALLDAPNPGADGKPSFACYNLYSLTLFGGGIIRFTNCQVDIKWAGNTWSANGVGVDPKGSRSVGHWKIGLDVDTWVVTVLPRIRDDQNGEAYPDKIGGVPWVSAARAGALDNAEFQVDRAYFAAAPTFPLSAGNYATPVGIITMFAGLVGEVDVGDTTVVINAIDHRSLLSMNLPHNYFRSSCRHTLFDAGCQLVAASFKTSGTVGASSTRSTIHSTIAAPPGSATYALGRIVMTSGNNNTFSIAVRSWSGGVLSLLRPLPYDVVVGDTFDAYPGCNKTRAQCVQFSNEANYGGEDSIPAPEVSI